MSAETVAGFRIPLLTVSLRALEPDDGLDPLPEGSTVLLLAHSDGEVLCCADGARFFRVPAEGLTETLRPADVAADSGGRTAMAAVAALLTVGGGALQAAEAGGDGGIRSLGDALWYAINTISTVGVGDVTPVTPMGKLIASAMMVIGIPLYARMGEEMFRSFLGPTGRDSCSRLADGLREAASALTG